MSNCRSRATAIALVAFVAGLGSTSVVSQQVDQAALQKQFAELYAAGKYADALANAQQQESAARRNGTNNPAYMVALTNLAGANQALGQYARAATQFAQVLGAFQRPKQR